MGERADPFTRNMYAFLCGAGLVCPMSVELPFRLSAAQLDAPSVLSGPDEQLAVHRFVSGKTVFVPLCGDTAALAYFARCGARCVIGADLCAAALHQQRTTRFPDVPFDTRQVGDGLRVYEAKVRDTSVTLFEGDITRLAKLDAYTARRVDFVYDRAALMAVPPALREAYISVVTAVMTPDACVAMERMVRVVPAEAHSGPPFMVDMGETRRSMEKATGRAYRALRVLVEEYTGTRYPEWYAIVPEV